MANNDGVKTDFLSFLTKHSKKITIFLVLFCIITIAAAGITYWSYTTAKSDVLALVGTEKITKRDLNGKFYGINLSGDVNSPTLQSDLRVSDEESAQYLDILIEESVIRQEAAKRNIVLTEADVLERAKADSPLFDEYTDEQKSFVLAQAKNNELRDRLSADTLGWAKGRYIKIHFDKHLFIAASLNDEQKAARLVTQSADIAKDRKYADDLKADIYSKLLSGTLTFDQAMELVRNDKYIDYSNENDWNATLGDPAVTFDTFSSPLQGGLYKDVNFSKALQETNKGETAKPYIGQLDYSEPGDSTPKMTDSMWIILTVDDKKDGANTNFDLWLKDQVSSTNVKKLKTNYSKWDLLMGNIYARGYLPTDLVVRSAYAWSNTSCTSGRTNLGSSHPGDLITDTRKMNADRTGNVPFANTYSYTRNKNAAAYAYSGCPLADGTYSFIGINDWSRSENSNSAGCMYRFSKVSGAPLNLCCSGNHNPHGWAVSNADTTKEAHGHWGEFFYGTTDGSKWNGPYVTNFHAAWGATYSNSADISFNIVNGDTHYRRAYWVIDANRAPVASTVSTTTPGSTMTFTGKTVDPDTGDTVIGKPKLRYKAFGSTTWGAWYYPGSTVNYGYDPNHLSASGTLQSKAVTGLVNGDYEWAWYGKDMLEANDTSDAVPFRIGTPPGASITITPSADAGCSISPATLATLASGANSTTYTGTALSGYEYDGFSIDGAAANGLLTPYRFNAVTASHTIRARCHTAPVSNLGLSCEVTPPSGETPLVVKVAATPSGGTVGPYEFTMNADGVDKMIQSGKSSPTLWYTYSVAGLYRITVKAANFGPVDCPPVNPTTIGDPRVNVTDPTGGTGGEVRP